MRQISIIVAIAENLAIGKNNQLLWHIPEDLKRVKELTTANVIIMGKNTYFSLPKRPLPGRTNLVISDDLNDDFEGCVMAYSLDDVLEKMSDDKENFIFGGASVYRQFFPLASKLYITLVHKDYDGDAFFPEINFNDWIEVERTDFPFDENTTNDGKGYSTGIE